MTGRMSTIKGFSLRLSAQLVYGISVVYNMKVIYLYSKSTGSTTVVLSSSLINYFCSFLIQLFIVFHYLTPFVPIG